MAWKLRNPSRYLPRAVSSLTSHEHQVLHALPAARTLPKGHERVPRRGRGQPGAGARRYEGSRLGAGEELRVRVEGYQGSAMVAVALISSSARFPANPLAGFTSLQTVRFSAPG